MRFEFCFYFLSSVHGCASTIDSRSYTLRGVVCNSNNVFFDNSGGCSDDQTLSTSMTIATEGEVT